MMNKKRKESPKKIFVSVFLWKENSGKFSEFFTLSSGCAGKSLRAFTFSFHIHIWNKLKAGWDESNNLKWAELLVVDIDITKQEKSFSPTFSAVNFFVRQTTRRKSKLCQSFHFSLLLDSFKSFYLKLFLPNRPTPTHKDSMSITSIRFSDF